MSITRNEKVAQIRRRVREIERLASPPTLEAQLSSWEAKDLWSADIIGEINSMIALLDTLIKELENGS